MTFREFSYTLLVTHSRAQADALIERVCRALKRDPDGPISEAKDERGWTNVEVCYNALGVYARFEYSETHYCHSLAMAASLIGENNFSKEAWQARHTVLMDFPRRMELKGLKGEMKINDDRHQAKYRYLFTVQSPR